MICGQDSLFEMSGGYCIALYCVISKEYVFVDFISVSHDMGCGIVLFCSAGFEIKECRAQMRSMLAHRLRNPRETTAKKIIEEKRVLRSYSPL